MNNTISSIQQELLGFFTPSEIPSIKKQLKQVFSVAAFESEIAKNEGGQDALYSLYHIIEILDEEY